MARKIKLTESDLRRMIYEAIGDVVGDDKAPNNNNPVQAAQPAQTTENPAQNMRLIQDDQTNEKLRYAIKSIDGAKMALGNLLSTILPGSYHGLPEDVMQKIREGASHLDVAEQIFNGIINR